MYSKSLHGFNKARVCRVSEEEMITSAFPCFGCKNQNHPLLVMCILKCQSATGMPGRVVCAEVPLLQPVGLFLPVAHSSRFCLDISNVKTCLMPLDVFHVQWLIFTFTAFFLVFLLLGFLRNSCFGNTCLEMQAVLELMSS